MVNLNEYGEPVKEPMPPKKKFWTKKRIEWLCEVLKVVGAGLGLGACFTGFYYLGAVDGAKAANKNWTESLESCRKANLVKFQFPDGRPLNEDSYKDCKEWTEQRKLLKH